MKIKVSSTEEKSVEYRTVVITADVSAKGGPAFYAVEPNSFLFSFFVIRQCKKLAAGRWDDFRLKNFILKYFQKLMQFQLLTRGLQALLLNSNHFIS